MYGNSTASVLQQMRVVSHTMQAELPHSYTHAFATHWCDFAQFACFAFLYMLLAPLFGLDPL